MDGRQHDSDACKTSLPSLQGKWLRTMGRQPTIAEWDIKVALPLFAVVMLLIASSMFKEDVHAVDRREKTK